MGVGGQHHALAALPPGKDPVPIVQEAGWAPGPVWTGAENLAPTGIRSPDRPARNDQYICYHYIMDRTEIWTSVERGPDSIQGQSQKYPLTTDAFRRSNF